MNKKYQAKRLQKKRNNWGKLISYMLLFTLLITVAPIGNFTIFAADEEGSISQTDGDGGSAPSGGDTDGDTGDGGGASSDGENGEPSGDGENGEPSGDGENGEPSGDGENGEPSGDGEDGEPSGDGEDGEPSGDGEQGAIGAPEEELPENSISGNIWLDVYQDTETGAFNGDGIRQPEEDPLPDFEVGLYLASDKTTPIDIVYTDADGKYCFEDLAPDVYVVGLYETDEYLLPIIGDINPDELFSDYVFGDFEAGEYSAVFSKPLTMTAGDSITDIDAGMRTPPGIVPTGGRYVCKDTKTGVQKYIGTTLQQCIDQMPFGADWTIDISGGDLNFAPATLRDAKRVTLVCTDAEPALLKLAAGFERRHVNIVYASSVLTLDNVILEGNKDAGVTETQRYSGGVSVNPGSLIMKNGAAIKNCYSSSKGGGINASNSGKLVIESGCSIENCQSGIKSSNPSYVGGGGIWTSSIQNYFTTTIQEGVTIKDCVTYGSGGGIYMEGDINVTLGGATATTEISLCKALGGSGGGIYVAGNGTNANNTLTVGEKVEIKACTAKNYGGGIAVFKSGTKNPTLTLKNGVLIDGNVAQEDAGGGIFLDSNVNFTFQGGSINNNKAVKRGGGLCTDGPFTMTDGMKISNNTVYGDNGHTQAYGGGLYVGGDFTMTGGSLQNNLLSDEKITPVGGVTYEYLGGGVYVQGRAAITGGLIQLNRVSNGKTGGGGGGICARWGLTMTGGTVNLNYSSRRGGGIYIPSASAAANTISTNAKITNNKADGSGFSGVAVGSGGGGIFVEKDATLTVSNGAYISANHADAYSEFRGGGILVYGKLYLRDTTTKIENNTADYGGGIALMGADAQLIIDQGAPFIQNNTATYDGGGIQYANYSANTGKIDISSGATIQLNFAGRHGGGIYCGSGELTLYKTSITANKTTGAAGDGAGVYFSTANGKSFRMFSGKIDSNTATNGKGGGIYSAGHFAIASNVIIELNKAVDGGGIYSAYEGMFILNSDVTLANNTAYNKGGGIYALGCQLNDGATVKLNSAGIAGGGVYHAGNDYNLIMVNGSNNTPQIILNTVYAAGENVLGGGGVATEGNFIMNGGVISNNTVNSDKTGSGGGGVLGLNTSTVWLHGGSVGDNKSVGNLGRGGGVYVQGFVESKTPSKIQYNSAYRGAGVYSTGTYNMNSGSINENNLLNAGGLGGGVYLDGTGTFTFSGGAIWNNNTATSVGTFGKQGGGIYVGSTATLNMNGGSISGNVLNASASQGGGVYVAGTMTMNADNDKVWNNQLTNYNPRGVGVYVAPTGSFTMKKGSIYTNKADDDDGKGGGVFTVGKFTMEGGTISGNILGGTDSKGGGVYVGSGSNSLFTLKDGTISDNKIIQRDGMGLGVFAAGVFNMDGGTIKDHKSSAMYMSGGGVCTQGTFNVTGGTITGNELTGQGGKGGGIHATSSAKINMKDCYVTWNKTTGTNGYGGGIYAQGNLTFTSKVYVKDNESAEQGGGVWYSGSNFTMGSGCEISRNTLSNGNACGAGVYLEMRSGGTFNLNGGEISLNEIESTTGAGVYLKSGTMNMSGGSIHNNKIKAVSTTSNVKSGYGAGVYTASGTTLNLSGTGEIHDNIAPDAHAAGLGISALGVVNIFGGKIYNHSSSVDRSNGGGVAVWSGGTFNMTGGEIYNNKLTGVNSYGGGVYIALNSATTAKMTGGEIFDNATTGNGGRGGGIYVQTTFIMDGATATIRDNKTATFGGGVYSHGPATNGKFQMKKGTISGNKCGSMGAGVAVTAGGFEMSGGHITANEIDAFSGQGAGVYVSGSTGFTMSGGEIHENIMDTRNGEGIGVYTSYASPVTMSGGKIYDHVSAGEGILGGGLYTDRTFTMTGGTISGNELTGSSSSGGGVWANGAVTINGADALITLNEAGNIGGGVYNAGEFTLNAGTISGNKVLGRNARGGGVYTLDSFTMTDGTISGNKALGVDSQGGGVWANGAVTINGADALIDQNEADMQGGGVYAYSTFDMTGGTISKNELTGKSSSGGGVWAKGAVDISGGTISGNKALEEFSVGGGVRANASVNISGASTLITLNKAEFQGGGVYAAGAFDMTGGTISHNEATGLSSSGGGVWAIGAVTINGVNAKIASNTADWFGGGVYTLNTFKLTAGEISGNALGRTDGEGGGVWAQFGVTLDGADAKIAGNNGRLHGGGVYTNSTFAMTDGEISGNFVHEADGQGGGVWAKGAVVINGADALIDQNEVGRQGDTNMSRAAQGGGVYTPDAFTMTDGTISRNKAFGIIGQGGGVWAQGVVVINGGDVLITLNEANLGGGVFATGTFDMSAGTISENKALGINSEGGGVWAYNVVTINGADALITLNEAGEQGSNGKALGGGLYTTKSFELTAGTISENKALGINSEGGGVWAQGAVTINDADALITLNEAGEQGSNGKALGGGLYTSGKFTLSAGTINNNKAFGINGQGGGVYVQSNSSINGTNAKITANTAGEEVSNGNGQGGGVYSTGILDMKMGEISANKALGENGEGGGIYSSWAVSASGVNSLIDSNEAGGQGGGIYAPSIELSGASVSNNKAYGINGSGGGIYLNPSLASHVAKLHLTSGTISNNKATVDGGAIYYDDYDYNDPADTSKYAKLHINNSVIFSGNTSGKTHGVPSNGADFLTRSGGNTFDGATLLNNDDINYHHPGYPVVVTTALTGHYGNALHKFEYEITVIDGTTNQPLANATLNYTGGHTGLFPPLFAGSAANGTVTLDANGKGTFEIMGGQMATFKIAPGHKVTVVQTDAEAYDTYYSLDGTLYYSGLGATSPTTITNSAGHTFYFENEREPYVITGIADLPVQPMIFISVGAVAAIVLLSYSIKRRGRGKRYG